MSLLAETRRELREWWRNHRHPPRVASAETQHEGFWANGLDDAKARRRLRVLRWLRRRGRLHGAQVTRLRAVVSVAGERAKQAENDRRHLKRKAAQ